MERNLQNEPNPVTLRSPASPFFFLKSTGSFAYWRQSDVIGSWIPSAWGAAKKKRMEMENEITNENELENEWKKKGRPVSGDDDLVVVVAFFLCWLIWIFFSLMRRVRSRRHSFGFTRSVRRAPARERTVWNVAGRRTLANNPLINVVQSRLIDASLSVSLEVISSDGVSNYFVGFNGNEIQWVISRTTTTT